MSQKTSSSNDLSTLYRTNAIYLENAHEANLKKYIELTKKQVTSLITYDRYGLQVADKRMILVDSSDTPQGGKGFTMAKTLVRLPQIPHSPVLESNESSKKIMETNAITSIIDYELDQGLDGENYQAVFLTISFENADLNQLGDAQLELKFLYNQLKEWFRKTFNKKSAVKVIGGVPSLERTINKEKLKKQDPHGIFHPHFHILLFLDTREVEELNISLLESKIWNKYKELAVSAGVHVARKGFFLEKVYSKATDNNEKKHGRDLKEAIAEEAKYTTKPEDFNGLKLVRASKGASENKKKKIEKENDFRLKIFADLYNSVVRPYVSNDCKYKNADVLRKKFCRSNGKKTPINKVIPQTFAGDREMKPNAKYRLDPFGVYKQARELYNALCSCGLAGIFCLQPASGDASQVPTFFTRAVELSVKKVADEQKAGYRYETALNREQCFNYSELIYYNCSLLGGSFFPSKQKMQKVIQTNLGLLHAKESKSLKKPKKLTLLVDLLTHYAEYIDDKTKVTAVFRDWISTLLSARKDGYDHARVEALEEVQKAYQLALDGKLSDPVREWKAQEDAKIFAKWAKENPISDKDKKELRHMAESGEWLLTAGNQSILKPAINFYVTLVTDDDEMGTSKPLDDQENNEKQYFGLHDWNYWKGLGMDDPTDNLKKIVYMMLYAYCDDEKAYAKLLLVGSDERLEEASKLVRMSGLGDAISRLFSRYGSSHSLENAGYLTGDQTFSWYAAITE